MATKKPEVHLFIDTNVLLGFLAYTKDDLDELEKLVTLIDAGAIRLHLSRQVVDEFYRNRESKLAESLAKFKASPDKGCPSFMQSFEEYTKYTKALAIFEKSQSDLINKAKEHAEKRTLLADELFSKLAAAAKVTDISDKAYLSALRRHRLGNPPGKDNVTVGDELNWELLLEAAPESVDLHIVSKDGDFASKLNPAVPKSFLADEWAARIGGKLYLYSQIGQFFEANFLGEDFLLKAEKQDAIENLIGSVNFASTHSAISAMEPYIRFLTKDEANDVISGCLSNSQIRWIVGDPDVYSFLKSIYLKFGESLSESLRPRLEELVGQANGDSDDPESEEGDSES